MDKVKEVDADLVAMSALLTTTMPNMKATIEALKEAGLREKVKVKVGGAPLTTNMLKILALTGMPRMPAERWLWLKPWRLDNPDRTGQSAHSLPGTRRLVGVIQAGGFFGWK